MSCFPFFLRYTWARTYKYLKMDNTFLIEREGIYVRIGKQSVSFHKIDPRNGKMFKLKVYNQQYPRVQYHGKSKSVRELMALLTNEQQALLPTSFKVGVSVKKNTRCIGDRGPRCTEYKTISHKRVKQQEPTPTPTPTPTLKFKPKPRVANQ